MPDPQIRAADVDREAVVRRLGEHMAAGRLTVAEYEDRSARAYAAKTYGDLAELTADLPAAPRSVSPASTVRPDARPAAAAGHPCGAWGRNGLSSQRSLRAAAWGSWVTTAFIVTTIWLITSIASGGLLYFWPIWVIGPWGAVLLAQTVTGGPHGRSRRRHHH